MVRHEAGEALGAIGDPSSREILKEYKNVIFKRLFQNSFVFKLLSHFRTPSLRSLKPVIWLWSASIGLSNLERTRIALIRVLVGGYTKPLGYFPQNDVWLCYLRIQIKGYTIYLLLKDWYHRIPGYMKSSLFRPNPNLVVWFDRNPRQNVDRCEKSPLGAIPGHVQAEKYQHGRID